MSGVYGDFIENFPELMETFSVWTDVESNAQKIRGIYIPTKGGGIDRRKITSGNWILDRIDSDMIFVQKIIIDDTSDATFTKIKNRMANNSATTSYEDGSTRNTIHLIRDGYDWIYQNNAWVSTPVT